MGIIGVGEAALAIYGTVSLLTLVNKKVHEQYGNSENRIGRIFLRGPIIGYTPSSSPLSVKERITPTSVERRVEEAMKKGVRGIIFDIDSPGGEVVPSKEIADYIKRIEVQTVGLVKGYAASGAYWIASACDQIIANEFSVIGSIGVIMPHIDASGLAQKLGLAYDGIKTGTYKDMGSPHRPFTSEERRILQQELDLLCEGFIAAIAKNRQKPVEEIRAVANGLIYHGARAKELGLIDALGNTEEALAYLRDQTATEKLTIENFGKHGGLLSLVLGSGEGIGMAFGRGIGNALAERLEGNSLKLR